MTRAPCDHPAALRPLLALIAIALLGAGCLGFPKESAPVRYWLLSALEGTPSDEEVFASVGVGPFEFPDYLDRLEIVQRTGPNQLSVSEFDRWGEPLEQTFQDVLAANLQILVPGVAAVRFPWKGARQVEYRLAMVVSRFEVDVPSGAAALDASWGFVRNAGGEDLGGGRANIREPVQGEGYAAKTAALSRALATLSRDVAKRLAALPGASGSTTSP
jgi:uncharacterized lipoprotein YmbA